MRKTTLFILQLPALLAASVCTFAQPATFTYQGLLKHGNTAANGNYDLEFTIYDASGASVGGTLSRSGVNVSNGVFTVLLDPDRTVFNGAARFLQIAVRPAGSPAAFTPLLPRQPITATPYALFALHSSASLNNFIRGNYPGVGGGRQNATDGDYPAISGGQNNTAIGSHTTIGGGQNNTAVDSHTTVGGGFRNVSGGPYSFVGGGEINTAAGQWATVAGGNNNQSLATAATIGGGQNNVSGDRAFVGGGAGNRAEGNSATVAGGNANQAAAALATIGGGENNRAEGPSATIGGGQNNVAIAPYSVVGGGSQNGTAGSFSTVPGGHENVAAGNYSLAAGRRAKADHPGAFVWADSTFGDFASTAIDQFNVRASGGVRLQTGGAGASLDGPLYLFESGTANPARMVLAHSPGFPDYGLQYDDPPDRFHFLSGGNPVMTVDLAAQNVGIGAAIPSAKLHVAGNVRASAFEVAAGVGVSMGAFNSLALKIGNIDQVYLAPSGLVGIGTGPEPQAHLHLNSFDNLTSLRLQSFPLSGHARLEFYGGSINGASEWRPGYIQSVGDPLTGWNGGLAFFVNGSGSANRFGATEVMRVENGNLTINGNLQFNTGSLRQMVDLWNGQHAIGVQSWTTYFRTIGAGAGGSFAWYKGGNHSNGQNDPGGGVELMRLSQETGLWVNGAFVSASDRNVKAGFQPVNPKAILEKVAALPITRWHYTNNPATPHLGPIAQDFHAAFGLGPDDKHIATVDADGVALAAIQGLNQKLEEKQARIEALEKTVAELKALMADIVAVKAQ